MPDDATIGALLPDFAAMLNDPAFQATLNERDAESIAAEARRAQQRRRDAITSSGMLIPPEDVEAIATGEVRDTKSMRAVRWMVSRAASSRNGKPAPRFLVLLGDRGIGKTIACAWAIAEVGQGLAISADDLGREINAHKRDALVERIMRSRILVVDDLGTETRDLGLALYDVVNRRASVPYALTLFTSNLTRAGFDARYDARVIDRIVARGFIGSIAGENLRKPLPAPGAP